MKTLILIVKRNVKLFFKDKGMFFTSLITPVIMLVLYVTFLGNVYENTFLSLIPNGIDFPEELVKGYVCGQLISSIIGVSCITVAFCSNMLIAQDKSNGTVKDLTISPVKRSVLGLGYYFATLISTLTVCLTAAGICLAYAAIVKWYMSAADVLLLLLDVFLLVLFGTALSSIINFFLSTQGQISAVGTIVSSGYGFICGAYMPISQFSEGLQRVISFLPGTYGTSLVRNHAMGGVLREMERTGISSQAIEALRDSVDLNMYFFGSKVEIGAMYAILCVSIVVLIAVYVFMNARKQKAK